MAFARILAAGGIALAVLAAAPGRADAGDLPAGFYERTVLDGLNLPTAVRFAPDGRVFVAEKDGVLKVFDGLYDPTPQVFADLRREVNSFGDRGLLGLALDPDFANNGYVYALYTYDAPAGGTAPTYAGPGPQFEDFCVDQCEVSGRLVRLDRESGTLAEKVLIKDAWCNQWSSHTVGAIEFDAQGRLYVSGGDGANFNVADYGQQIGTPSPARPPNPCGDPPGPENTALSPPSAEGGALRSQDLRTMSDPVDLSGTIARVDPATGDGVAANPLSSSPDANARRVLAYGLRNPYRFVVSPAGEVWIGDAGWRNWEEINSFSTSAPAPVNFGWPCYEGAARQPGYDVLDLTLCEDLYAAPDAASAPHFAYSHHNPLYSGDTCPVPGDGSAATGIEIYGGNHFPAPYDGALFFSDYARHCIWVMREGASGRPDPTQISAFDANVVAPVDLEVGPDGALYYVDIGLGEVRRIRYSPGNTPPQAVATASPAWGDLPLEVQFDGSGSSDADAGSVLTYAWDLDGDGLFDDSNQVSPFKEYTAEETVVASLRVTDPQGETDVDRIRIDAGNNIPVAQISGPAPGTTWATGQTLQLIGGGSDPDEGTLGASALRWTVDLNHCVAGGGCHVHPLQSITGATDPTVVAPDHYYPAHLTIRLIATDAKGLQSAPAELRLDPRTVELSLASVPSGLALDVNGVTQPAPFTVTAIENSAASVAAPSPQSLGGVSYDWSSWSDGGDRVHEFQATSNRSLTAVFEEQAGDPPPPPELSLEVLRVRQPRTAWGLADRGIQSLARCSADCLLEIKLVGIGKRARKAGLKGKLGSCSVELDADVGYWVRSLLARKARRQLLADPDRRINWIKPRYNADPAESSEPRGQRCQV